MAYYGKNNDGLIIKFLPWTCIVIAHIILKNQNILVQELWFGILTSQILTAKSHDKLWLILYVRGLKLSKTAHNCQILNFLAILGIQNDLTGDEICKK